LTQPLSDQSPDRRVKLETGDTLPGRGMSDASALCLNCGLCCDGTLFAKAKLLPAELPAARQACKSTGTDATEVLTLPCHFLRGTACGIYDERFHVCRKFRCELLKKLQSGIVSLKEASAIVADAKRWRHDALADDTGDASQICCKRLRRRPKVGEQTDSHAAAQALKLTACRRFLVKHFIHPSQAKLWGWSA